MLSSWVYKCTADTPAVSEIPRTVGAIRVARPITYTRSIAHGTLYAPRVLGVRPTLAELFLNSILQVGCGRARYHAMRTCKPEQMNPWMPLNKHLYSKILSIYWGSKSEFQVKS